MFQRTCGAGGMTTACIAAALMSTAAFGQTETQTEAFLFPLSPNQQTLTFDQFDEMGGARQLIGVQVDITGTIEAAVTAENDSAIPAPDFAIQLSGFLASVFPPAAVPALLYDATFDTGGVVIQPSDGIPGSGPDFFDFGVVSQTLSTGDTPADLNPYRGVGTLSYTVQGAAGFSVIGGVDSTIVINMLQAFGEVVITYEFIVTGGACCLADNSCVDVVDEAACMAAGGTFQGAGTDCATTTCPQACCFDDGTCQDLLAADCTAAGGIPQGDGTNCGAIVCPQPGACCLPNFTCIVVLETACTAQGGIFQGEGLPCIAGLCDPIGACCLDDVTCIDAQTLTDCTNAGGIFQGDGTLCATVNCAVDECQRVSTTEKGSLIILSKIELRWSGTAPHDLIQDTYFSLTNDNTSDVRVQLYFVNGDDPLPADPVTGERAHPGWNKVDNQIVLTSNQPACFRASDGTGTVNVAPFPVLDPGDPPGRPAMDGTGDRVLRGFLYVWAIDNQGHEIRWNHLFGNGTIVNYGGRYAWEYQSWNHHVVADVPNGQAPDATPGQILFDGIEYSFGFDRLRFNFLSSGSDKLTGDGTQVVNELDLTLHPEDVDFRQEGDGPVTTKADFLVWNENETPFSQMHRCLTCWDQQIGELYTSLPEQIGVPNNFLESTLQTDCGYARIEGRASQLCDLDFDPANNDTFPFPPGPGDPVDPRDVVSQDVALLGVAARLLRIDLTAGGYNGASGYNLVGTGIQAGVVRYDPSGGSDEGVDLPMKPTRFELDRFLDRVIKDGGVGSAR